MMFVECQIFVHDHLVVLLYYLIVEEHLEELFLYVRRSIKDAEYLG